MRKVAARNLWLRREQSRLLRLLADAGVQARGVKGVGLVERLYPDLSWREVEDVDILVEKSQAGRAFAALRRAGLAPNHEWTPDGLSRPLSRSIPLATELVFRDPGGLTVELHWDWPGKTLDSPHLARSATDTKLLM